MLSEIIAFFAVCTSLAALVFSWVVFKKDKNKDYQNLIFNQKISKYQEFLKLGRLLVYQVGGNSDSKKNSVINDNVGRLFDLSDECSLLVPSKIAMKLLKFAVTAKNLNEARANSDKKIEKKIYKEANKELADILMIARNDLGLDNLNKLLLDRVKI